MDASLEKPQVTVITPVYNGEPYLDECIQSVLRQTYENIRYVIADNCSTDRSLEMAHAAAAADDRITVVSSSDFVGVIQNWNRSLANLAPSSKYIKFIHADDWLYPECIARMVEVAESDPQVALVSSYRLEENRVSLDHLPAAAPREAGRDSFIMNGRDVAKSIFVEHASVLGSPSSLLMRTENLSREDKFYDERFLHADKDAALKLLKKHKFGFVRQVLMFTRRHNESVSSIHNRLDTRRLENLQFLKSHGPAFLSAEEYRLVWKRELRDYYDFLSANVAVGQDSGFWDAHTANLRQAGVTLSRPRLLSAFCRRWLDPRNALKQLLKQRSALSGRNA